MLGWREQEMEELQPEDPVFDEDSEMQCSTKLLKEFAHAALVWNANCRRVCRNPLPIRLALQCFLFFCAFFHSSSSFFFVQRNLKWNLNEAENRQIRRAMEAENKSDRKEQRKEYNDTVRRLVAYVKRRDPRYVQFQLQQAKEEKIKRAKAELKKEKEEEEKALKRAQARKAEEERWAERERERIAAGEASSSEERYPFQSQKTIHFVHIYNFLHTTFNYYFFVKKTYSEEEVQIFYCEPCKKSFKSKNAFISHEKSKKHKEMIKKIQRQMLAEDKMINGK